MCTFNTINRLSVATFAAPITTTPERPADTHEIIGRLRLRFVRQQQAHLDELLREGGIDQAIRVLAAQVAADAQACSTHRFPSAALRHSRQAA